MDYIIYSIEDDKDISKIINKTLSKQGFIVYSFYDGKSFYEAFNQTKPNMILLDMMLPDMSGIDILKNIRANSNNDDIEIIIVSAKQLIMDKVDGLDLGADDYIEKPFNILELMSRVNVKYRRFKKNNIYKIRDLSLDSIKHIVLLNDKEILLTVKEFEILELLMKNKGSVVSRDLIFSTIWSDNDAFQSRTVDMHIKSIRQKIGDDSYIKTIYGIGYRID